MDSIKGTDEKYLTVSELNWYVKQKFDRDPYRGKFFSKGNCRISASGEVVTSTFL